MKLCCDAFAKEAGRLQAPAGGGNLYPEGSRPNAQFEPDRDKVTWNVNGCCGGGCFVVTEMRFCPFCGTALEARSQAKTTPATPEGVSTAQAGAMEGSDEA